MEIDQKNISQKFRQHYGITQRELAELCQKSRSTVMMWEYTRGCPMSTAFVLQNILDKRLSAKQMIMEFKQLFDKPDDHKSI